MEARYVDINGSKIYCEIAGEGPPLLLINGGNGNHEAFHPYLSPLHNFCTVVYCDPAGCGNSEYKSAGDYTVESRVGDYELLRRKLGFESWSLLGFSTGSMTAQLYSVKHPERIDALVLTAAAPMNRSLLPSMRPDRLNEFISPEEKANIEAVERSNHPDMRQFAYNRFVMGEWKRWLFYKPLPADMLRIAWSLRDFDHHAIPGFGESIKALDFPEFDFGNIPTLLIDGKWDLLWNSRKSEIMRNAYPKAKVAVLENAGHYAFIDQPEPFTEAVRNHICE